MNKITRNGLWCIIVGHAERDSFCGFGMDGLLGVLVAVGIVSTG